MTSHLIRSPGIGFAVVLGIALLAGPGPASAESFLDQARDAVRDAGRDIENAAKAAGRSIQDFLVDNPDLNRDIVDFGKRVGVPGFEETRPDRGARVVLMPFKAVPGDPVTVTAVGLPGGADVSIAAGMSAATAVPVGKAKTSERGVLDVDVKVPAIAKAGESLVFVVETADGRVRLVSDPFRVLDPADLVTVVGTLSKEGAECPALRGDDGKLYTLTPNDLGAFGPGDRVKVRGTVAPMSICQQGTTITVTSIAAP